MIIELQVASGLRQKVSFTDKSLGDGKNLGGDKWEIPEATSVASVLRMLNLTNIPTILVLNDHQENKKTILKENDVLKIFSAVSGG